VLTVPQGGTRTVDTAWDALRLTVAMYGEGYDEGRPKLSIRAEVRTADGQLDLNLGNPEHHVGYVGWSTASEWHTGSIVYAPTTADGVRMRVRLYTTRPSK
jgi:hypothetical protein